MDTEKSSNSSFEDLSNLNETELKTSTVKPEDDILDIVGNGQLLKKIIKSSENDIRPQRGDYVTINYTGRLEDGTVVENEQNFEIHVGDSEIVQGIDLALALMPVGEIAELTVDARFGYGSLGLKKEDSSVIIPPNAKIIYTLELLDCKTEDDMDAGSYEARKKFGNRKRERANFWYNRNEFNVAIQVYRRALEYLDDTDGGITDGQEESTLTNTQLQDLLEDRLIVYNNLAMAQIKISAFDAALTSVENVLRCQPNNSKALFRKGRILDAKGDTKGAIILLQKAATLEPDSKSIQQDLAKLIIKSRREERNEKEMYQKMLGQAKKLEQKTHKNGNNKADIPKLKLLGYFMGSILIGVAGVAMYRYKY